MSDEDPTSSTAAADGGGGDLTADHAEGRPKDRRVFVVIWMGVALAVVLPVLGYLVKPFEAEEYVAPPGAVENVAVVGEDVLVLPSEPTTPFDVVAVVRSFDQRVGAVTTAVGRLDGPAPRWLGPRLTDEGSHPLVQVGDVVVTVDDGALRALSLDDGLGVLGVEAWRVPLAASFTWPCEDCIVAAGDRVVLRTDDGAVMAVDGPTGRAAWDRPADDDVVAVHAAGNDVVLVDGSGGAQVVAGADGTTSQTVAPDCPPSSPITVAADRPSAVTVVVLDDGAVVLGHGPGSACWTRVDPTSTSPAWTTAMPPTTGDTEGGVVRDSTTLVAEDGAGGLVTVDLTAGTMTHLATTTDARQVPVAVTPAGIVAAVEGQDGTWSVAALDPSTGATRWRHPLGADVPVLDAVAVPERIAAGTRHVAIGVDGDAVHLVALDSDATALEVVALDLGTGVAGSPATVDLPRRDAEARLVPLAWRAGDAVLMVNDLIVAVDLDDGRLLARTGS